MRPKLGSKRVARATAPDALRFAVALLVYLVVAIVIDRRVISEEVVLSRVAPLHHAAREQQPMLGIEHVGIVQAPDEPKTVIIDSGFLLSGQAERDLLHVLAAGRQVVPVNYLAFLCFDGAVEDARIRLGSNAPNHPSGYLRGRSPAVDEPHFDSIHARSLDEVSRSLPLPRAEPDDGRILLFLGNAWPREKTDVSPFRSHQAVRAVFSGIGGSLRDAKILGIRVGLTPELMPRDDAKDEGDRCRESGQPDHPPIWVRAPAIGFLIGCWAVCYWRGCKDYVRGRWRRGDLWHRSGLVALGLGLFLCCTIGIPATWGWWL